MLPLMKGLAPESIEIVHKLDPVPVVALDRSEFEQAIINLVVNAVDAMPEGGRLTIEVGLTERDAPLPTPSLEEVAEFDVLVAVSDTGVGMDDVTRSRIFEPFYTTKGIGEGTGLGLSMTFAAVERARGRIWVYSEPGQGTTFKIYLPSARPIDGPTMPAVEPRHLVAGGSESILLIEDEPMVRDLLVTVLHGAGYEVTAAALPSEAFALAAARRFDLLLTDVVMPQMMGNAVAAQLRLDQPDLRVVMMSGYTAQTLDFELGPFNSFVQKPLRSREVIRVVREALDRGRS